MLCSYVLSTVQRAAPLRAAPTRLIQTSASVRAPSLLTLADISVEQIESLLQRSSQFKQAAKRDGPAAAALQTLDKKTIAILFSKRSTRTRVASETSVALLGGHPMFLSPQDIQLGVNEHFYDTSRVVSSMVDGIMARVGGHEEIEVRIFNVVYTASCRKFIGASHQCFVEPVPPDPDSRRSADAS